MLPEQQEPAGAAVRSEQQEDEGQGPERPVEPAEVGQELPPASSAYLTGRQVGRYLVGERLGSGGAAKVYQAYDHIQERAVALKILSPGADDAVRSRFQQEARTVASLRHPHIVQTLQVGAETAEGTAYIAMELVEGDSLAQLLKRRGRLSVAESCNLLAPIARALDYAHLQEIVHRDVKPSNILLRPFDPAPFASLAPDDDSASALYEAEQLLVGTPSSDAYLAAHAAVELPVAPLLSDFGIARALDMPELTNEGRTIGTPAYMAPEQCANSRKVTGRADIYALGAVLYRCLVGRPPFTGTTTQILHAHVYAPLALPDDLLATLPPELVDVLRRSLAKNPDERYTVAREMADDLTAIAGRIASLESTLAEQTSTLTFVSLPPVGLPPSPSQTTETVIVHGSVSTLEVPSSQDIPSHRSGEPEAQPSAPSNSKRAQVPLMGVVLGFALLLGLMVIVPVLRDALRESPATAVQNPSGSAAPAAALPAAESQPSNTEELLQSQTTAGNVASPLSDPDAQAASAPPAALGQEAAACQYQTAVEFESYLGDSEPVALELGCPKGVPVLLAFEIQFFQTGLALGRLDKPVVYLRYFSNDEWEQREHAWRDGMQEVVDSPDLLSPAEDLFQPVRGIGQIWAESLFVRQALGWASAQPVQANGILQSFEGGLLIYNSDLQDTYIFLKSQLRL